MTDNFLPDVGINQFQFNVGNQLMFVGIIVFEVNKILSDPVTMLMLTFGTERFPQTWFCTELGLPCGLGVRSLPGKDCFAMSCT